ncbi:uncharacterized protein LOC124165961 isoform X1 [Ischnura elegans]|uniref:uncharacterized protein LOC124165961 isoform X1 n=1 Tax=Ischnura elegans TaxID=197161 RepID=UPI001ED86B61|nr:uncharacterized protein LOC124165961 isoform X1 [Ischnura elegans]
MACDFFVIFKVLELLLAIACVTFKQVTDDEGTRLQIILRKLSEEWPFLNSITWDEHGSSLADVTYGGYVIICAGLLAGQLAGELKYPLMEYFFLGVGIILYGALGGLELASLELLRPELVDNAAILGTLSLLMTLLFIFDLIAGNKRRKKQHQKVDHYWRGVTVTKSISTSTRGTQIDSDLDDEDEILSVASLPLPPPPGGIKTDMPRSQQKSQTNGRPTVHWEEGSEKRATAGTATAPTPPPSDHHPPMQPSPTPSSTRTHSSLAPLSPGYVQQTVLQWPSPVPCPSHSQPPSPSLSSYPSTPLPQDPGAVDKTTAQGEQLQAPASEEVKPAKKEVAAAAKPRGSLPRWQKKRHPKTDKSKMEPI